MRTALGSSLLLVLAFALTGPAGTEHAITLAVPGSSNATPSIAGKRVAAWTTSAGGAASTITVARVER